MGISQININKVKVRLAETSKEVEAAQRLRYRVFYEEYAAKPTEEMARARLDIDPYDAISDHLIVIDESIDTPSDAIIGTYRLLRRESAEKFGQFYTSGEYDIAPLLNCGETLLELGRSCVLADYRTRPVLQLLWQGITDYMLDHDIGLMFGCASLQGTNIESMAQPLAYMHHHHMAPEHMRPLALKERYVDMDMHPKEDLDTRTVFAGLPPLIKGYLRLGALIGEGAVIDHQFNTTDVCIVLPMKSIPARYKKHYARKVNRQFPDHNDTGLGKQDENNSADNLDFAHQEK